MDAMYLKLMFINPRPPVGGGAEGARCTRPSFTPPPPAKKSWIRACPAYISENNLIIAHNIIDLLDLFVFFLEHGSQHWFILQDAPICRPINRVRPTRTNHHHHLVLFCMSLRSVLLLKGNGAGANANWET